MSSRFLTATAWVVGAVLIATVIGFRAAPHRPKHPVIDYIKSSGTCARGPVADLLTTYAGESDTAILLADVTGTHGPIGMLDSSVSGGKTVYTGIRVRVTEVLSGSWVTTGPGEVLIPGGTFDGLTVFSDNPSGPIAVGDSTVLVVHQSPAGPMVGNSFARTGSRVILDDECQIPGRLPSQPFRGKVTLYQNGGVSPHAVSGYSIALSDLRSTVQSGS